MIYLTHYRTACTQDVELIDDIIYPQKVNWFPDTYNRTKSGLVYGPHKLAEKVLDPELLTYLRENPVGKTAFILAAGQLATNNIKSAPANFRICSGNLKS